MKLGKRYCPACRKAAPPDRRTKDRSWTWSYKCSCGAKLRDMLLCRHHKGVLKVGDHGLCKDCGEMLEPYEGVYFSVRPY